MKARNGTLIAILVVLVLSCGSFGWANDTPGTTYASFLTAVRNGDMQTAKTFFTPKKQMEYNNLSDMDQQGKLKEWQESSPDSYQVTKTEIYGKYATIYIKGKVKQVYSGDLQNASGAVLFTKVNGTWKIRDLEWGIDEL